VLMSHEIKDIPGGLRRGDSGGNTQGPISEVCGHGRGRRAGQTIKRETMKHGIPVPHQRTKPGKGRPRSRTSTPSPSQSATGGSHENKVGNSGPRGEIDSSQSGWVGSLSVCIVPMENRGTEKRRDPGSREGGRPRSGIDAGIHELSH